MVGKGLRKLAEANGMKVAHGVAYGFLRGYCATLFEGSGIKTMILSTRFADAAARCAFMEHIQSLGLDKEYKLNALEVQEKLIAVVFVDTIGTMKRIEGFIDLFLPLLDQFGASRSNICPECGMMLTGGSWKLINGIAVYLHEGCAERVRGAMEMEKEEQSGRGSYLTGAAGAFLGALGGAAVWALVMLLGYISSLVGLLIGFLSEKCYTWFRGKKGWGKLAILIVAVIFGVLVGNFGSLVIQCVKELELPVGESVSIAWLLTLEEPEIRSAMIKDTLLGLLFAGLGVFGIMRATKDEASGPKIIDLE